MTTLKALANELWREARAHPGTWQEAWVDRRMSAWKIGVSIEAGTGQLELRFRRQPDGTITPATFQAEARVLAGQLDAAGWAPQFRTEGLTWEATFLQPAPVQTTARV